jgi:hypothetical protein
MRKIVQKLYFQGLNGFEKQIDRFFELAKYLYNQILKRENFEIVLHDVIFLRY